MEENGVKHLDRSLSGRISKKVSAFAIQKLNKKVTSASAGDIQEVGGVKGISIKTLKNNEDTKGSKTPALQEYKSPKLRRKKKRSLDSASLNSDFSWKKPAQPPVESRSKRPMSLIEELKHHSNLKKQAKLGTVGIVENMNTPENDEENIGNDYLKGNSRSYESRIGKKRKGGRHTGKVEKAAKLEPKQSSGSEESEEDDQESTDGKREMSSLGSPVWLMFDSEEAADCVLKWIIHPLSVNRFFKEKWEEEPILIKRSCPSYYGDVFSTTDLDNIMRTKPLEFGSSIDVTRYINQKRHTYNPKGRAYASKVWKHYNEGCSVRMRDPTNHSQSVWKICQILQEAFDSFVGANVYFHNRYPSFYHALITSNEFSYLTPPGTQGFAPHWDDIDAFVLQLEGSKHWKVYGPREPDEKLPRESSENFSENDLPHKPIVEGDLEPGDFLYIPRGMIHQGKTIGKTHSLHITISVGQKNSWMDFFSEVLPAVLEVVGSETVDFRRSLPRNFLSTMGVANDLEKNEKARKKFKHKFKEMMNTITNTALGMIDESVDQYAKEYLHAALPPLLTENEKSCGVDDCGRRWNGMKNKVEGKTNELKLNDRVKLIRKHICRLMDDDEAAQKECVRIYHCVENTKNYKEKDPQYFDVISEARMCVYSLMESYPDYIEVGDIAVEDSDVNNDIRRELCQELFDRAMLIKETT